MQTVVKRKSDGTLVALVVDTRGHLTPSEIRERQRIAMWALKHGVRSAARRFKCSDGHVYKVMDEYEKFLSVH